jgi:hypothetical protein
MDQQIPPIPPQPSAAAQTPVAVTTPAASAPPRAPLVAGLVLPGFLGLLMVDAAVETVLAGSPIAWSVAGVQLVALAALALVWRRAGATLRLAIPALALAGTVAWACLRLGSGADPALRMVTLSLPRIGILLAAAAVGAALVMPFGLKVLRRAWYIGLVLALMAAGALVPLARGFFAGASLSLVSAGAFDWTVLPTFLQGSVLAAQVLLPVGLLAALALAGRAIAKRQAAAGAVAGVIVLACGLLAQSSEMLRAGRSTLLAPVAAPLLARVSMGPVEQGPPMTGATSPGGGATGLGQPNAPGMEIPATAPTPAPAGKVPVAQPGQPLTNAAVEVKVTNSRTAASIGGQTAEAGREFLIVEMAWKNLVPQQKVNRKKASDRTAGAGALGFGGGASAQDKADDEANTTIESVRFEVGPLEKHVWLVADGRFATPIDVNATRALDPHLGPEKISIGNFQEVVSGGLAFRIPAGAQAVSLLFLDSKNGHMLFPIKGAPPALAASLGGGARANEFVDIALTGAAWATTAEAADGTRRFLVGLRGISRQEALVDVPMGEYGFLQTDQGCLAEPDVKAGGLTRQLAPIGRFLPFVPSEGQLAFDLPKNATPIAFLLRLQQGGPIDLPLKPGARPQWPSAETTITDGDVLKVHRLPGLAVPTGVPPAPSGSERIALDLVVENLRSGAGIDLHPDQQFRIVTPDGKRIEPSRDSAAAPCRLGGNVVPAGISRRFTMVYDVPAGQPLQFEYRGFNVKSELVKVR